MENGSRPVMRISSARRGLGRRSSTIQKLYKEAVHLSMATCNKFGRADFIKNWTLREAMVMTLGMLTIG